MKVKCSIYTIANEYYLVSNRDTGWDDLVLVDNRIFHRKQLKGKNNPMRIEASASCVYPSTDCPPLPQYVIEAYNKGVREFEIEIKERTIIEPVFKMGMLEVTYNKPKKQTFTRDEVLGIMNTYPAIKQCSIPTEYLAHREKWLDDNYPG